MVQDLELIAQSAEAMPAGDYATLDVYTSGAMAMFCYTCIPHMREMERMRIGGWGSDITIGSQGSGFKPGGLDNIRMDIGFGLQERYDFSGHGGSKPHINYDILGTNINLGPAHKIDLFKK